MKTVLLAEATHADLKAYCALAGLEHAPQANANALRSLIVASGNVEAGGSFEIEDDAPAPKPVATKKDTVRIRIDDPTGEGGIVPLMLNGVRINVPKGEEVDLPRKYLPCLEHAEQLVYPEGVEGLGEPRRAKSYPYSILG